MGDTNCHHSAWSSYKNNSNGNSLYNYICNNNISICNDGKPTHFIFNHTSIIDLILCSSNLINNIQVLTLDDTFGSDHFPQLVYFNKVVPSSPIPNKYITLDRYNLKKANWNSFSEFMLTFHLSPYNEFFYPQLISHIKTACNLSIPRPTINANKNPCPWWNSNCSFLISLRKKAISCYRRSGLLSDFIEAKKIISQVKKQLKKIKKDSFVKFTNSLNRNSNISEVWKSINRYSSSFIQKSKPNTSPLPPS